MCSISMPRFRSFFSVVLRWLALAAALWFLV
jgi:hypothetical protein